MSLLFGLAAFVVVLWGVGVLARLDPKGLARGIKTASGVLAIAGAVFLAVRGQIGLAIPLGAAGLGLLGWHPFGGAGFGARTTKSAGRVSTVRSPLLEMQLEHDSGVMRGRVIAGRYEGRDLDTLDVAALAAFAAECDEESRALLAAYLDRRDPAWREHAQGDAAAGGGSAARHGPMSQEEAYQILGLEPGASADEIVRAHRNLMKRLHPDQGGSNYLAARVNEAKDALLRRHR